MKKITHSFKKVFNLIKAESPGFTLIELIVVMTIVSIVFIASISFAQVLGERSNNAKRESDLRVLESILQQYKVDQGFYPCSEADPVECPSPLDLSAASPLAIDSSSGNPNSVIGTPKTYITSAPRDPVADTNHCYIYHAYRNKFDATSATPAVCNNQNTVDPNNNCHYFRLYTIEEGPGTTAIVPNHRCPAEGSLPAGTINANYAAEPN